MGQYRGMIEATLFNLVYDMEYVGAEGEVMERFRCLSDEDLITVFNEYVEDMMISEVMEMTRNGLKWFYQEFDRHDGQLEAVNLYDSNGDFVREFDSYEDMTAYIERQ